MQQDPWAEFRTGPATQPSQPPTQNRAPGIIRGPAPTPDPYEVQQDQVQAENDSTRLNIALQAEQRAADQAQRGTVEQGKAASFLRRAINANQNYTALGGVEPRNIFGQAFKDAAPNLANTFSDEQRQLAEQGEREFIGAILRYDSGAAIPDSEFVTNGLIYFPRPGDTPAVLRQKAEARRVAIEGLYSAAGPAAAGIELPDFSLPVEEPQVRQPTARDEAPLGNELGFDTFGRDQSYDRARDLQERFGIQPGNETRLVGLLNANRGNENLTIESLRQIYTDAGVPLPSDDDMATLLSDLQSGKFGPTTGIDTRDLREEYQAGLDTALGQMGEDPESNAGAAIYGGARGLTFALNDEITGIGAAIGEALQGGNPADAYVTYRDLVRRQTERTREESPYISYGSEVVGSAITGGKTFGAPQTIKQAARVGAIEGGVYGFGSGEGAAGSTGNALMGSAGGAVIGGALQPVTNKVSSMIASRQGAKQIPNAQDVAQAAERQGVTMRAYEMNPQLRDARAQVQQTPQGRPQIAQADADDLAEVEAALVRGLGGSTTGLTEGGTAIQGGVRAQRASLRKRAQVAYRAAEAEAGDLQVPPSNALDAIDTQIEELAVRGAERNKGAIQYLRSIRRDVARRGGLSVSGLRDMRTNTRPNLENAGVYTGDLERRMGIVANAMSQDLQAALRAKPNAAKKFTEADGLWQRQAEFGGKIGNLLLGKSNNKGPGAAAAQVLNWARSDPQRLAYMIDETPVEMQQEVRALVAGAIGRQSNGDFSLAKFITDTGPGRGARLTPASVRSIFGEDGVRALQDLRTIAQAKVDGRSGINFSNTGGVVKGAANGLRRVLLGGFGFSAASGAGTGPAAAASAVAVIGGEIAQRLGTERTLRLVLNPDFSRWLKNTPNTANPAAIDGYFQRLRSVAQRTPGMMADVDAFERAIMGAVNDNSAGRMAAEEQPQE